jgi:thiol-disulfide isomerase/thioredoxin
MKKKNLFIYTAIAVLFGAMGAYAGITKQQSAAPAAAPVAALFAQTLPDPKGKPQALSQFKGKALLVNFWAPWCAPCVQEMPELSALAARSPKLQIIGIGIDSPANIGEFADKFKISYPLYVAGMSGTDLARQFGNDAGGLPYTVLIDADGKVRKTYLGRLKFEQLRADLATL